MVERRDITMYDICDLGLFMRVHEKLLQQMPKGSSKLQLPEGVELLRRVKDVVIEMLPPVPLADSVASSIRALPSEADLSHVTDLWASLFFQHPGRP